MAKVAQEQATVSAGAGGSSLGRLWRFWTFLAIDSGARGRIRLHTVAIMRWVAVVGQLFTILFVHFSLQIELPLLWLIPAVVLTGLVNLVLLFLFGARARLSERAASLLFAFDIAQLCWLLALTGGLQNPFAILLLLPVTLAAATLGFGPMILITGVGLVGASVLALVPAPLPWRPVGLTLPPLYLLAAWTALSMAVILIAIFAWSIAEEARRHADALTATQLALAREQKMSALGAQAAAAAHLLGSPLGTINVIAKELSRELPRDDPLHEEVMELLEQAQRCGRILASFGRPRDPAEHDLYTRAPLTTLLESIADEFTPPEKAVEIRLEAENGCAEPQLVLAPELRHALANLIDNAIQFAERRVLVTVAPDRVGLGLVIEDDGPGFSPEILDWLGEPYVSTRSGRGGMGLGVFIANTLLARTGARLHFDNGVSGARVSITWPVAAVERLERENAHDG